MSIFGAPIVEHSSSLGTKYAQDAVDLVMELNPNVGPLGAGLMVFLLHMTNGDRDKSVAIWEDMAAAERILVKDKVAEGRREVG